MAVITESYLRKHFKDQNLKEIDVYEVQKGVILTPSAKSFLSDHHIKLSYAEEKRQEEIDDEVKESPKEKKMRYQTIYGGSLDEKPEHMTQLYGNLLVFKDHPRIIFRGKLDSLEAKILEAQILAMKQSLPKLAKDLEEILMFVRNLVRCEVLGETVEEFFLLNMTQKELREQSHHPKKYFGLHHFQPSYEMGEAVIMLNSLRTLTRETELLGYEAFKNNYGAVEREDIIRALNRLSSLFWILMFKVRTNKYK